MKTDIEKLEDINEVFNNAIVEIERIGELKNYDLDQAVDKIYGELEILSIDAFSLLRETRGDTLWTDQENEWED